MNFPEPIPALSNCRPDLHVIGIIARMVASVQDAPWSEDELRARARAEHEAEAQRDKDAIQRLGLRLARSRPPTPTRPKLNRAGFIEGMSTEEVVNLVVKTASKLQSLPQWFRGLTTPEARVAAVFAAALNEIHASGQFAFPPGYLRAACQMDLGKARDAIEALRVRGILVRISWPHLYEFCNPSRR